MPSFIQNLRSRPLHQRHLILWLGSIVLFMLVFFLWTIQIKAKLASLGGIETGAQIQRETRITKKPSPPAFGGAAKGQEQIGGFFETLKSFWITLFDIGKREDGEKPLNQKKEGDELDQFLKYEPYPEE